MHKLNKIKFLLFYQLYRVLNGLALKCYEMYWDILNKENKCQK